MSPVGYHSVGLTTFETAEDRRIIEANLRSRFPDLKLMHSPWVYAVGANDRKGPYAVEAPQIKWAETTLEPCPDWWLGGFMACVPPENWTPQWDLSDGKVWRCKNLPRLRIDVPGVSCIRKGICDRIDANDEEKGFAVEYESLERRIWNGLHKVGDDEARRWQQRVVRVVKKTMTTQCCAVNKLTGRVKHKLQQGGIFWFAPGALAWTRERVDRFMDDDLRPIDEYDTYQWPLPVEGKRLPYSPKRRYEEREAYFRRTIDEPAAEREEKARLRKAEREKTRLSKA